MKNIEWNKNVKYRKIHDVHIVIDLKTNVIREISPSLALLFENEKFIDFSKAFELWEKTLCLNSYKEKQNLNLFIESLCIEGIFIKNEK